ncbi:MAG: hypothetical protein KJ058_03695 [Thermoanaerobaculia bacterium]|nr:hypothetical protein [Thermoanaerobaculia bacterium]
MNARRPWYRSDAAGCLLVIVSLLAISGLSKPVKDLFRLDGHDTVYDFHTASIEDRVDFLRTACDHGECIMREDWECGFFLDGGPEVRDCISDVAGRAKSWVTLDAVRKLCGQRFMLFKGDLYGNRDKCLELHGVWGQPSPAPRVVF